MSLIETYSINEQGYHPFLIRDGWQVAKLNYLDELHINNIDKIEAHRQTDEVFVLLKGKALLILVEFQENIPIFEITSMKPSVTYNVPKDKWHNIAMDKGSEVLIIEKSNTHLNDVEYIFLNSSQIADLRLQVDDILKKETKI
jgi:ureidoglycolate hydrolase